MFKNIIQATGRLDQATALIIANDDGDWHVHKNVIRALYATNGGNYFMASATETLFPSTYIYQYTAQFQAAPAGTTKTINAIAISENEAFATEGTYSRLANALVAGTRLPGAGETQDEFTVLNLTYKLTFTI
jgi:hypothetical protein